MELASAGDGTEASARSRFGEVPVVVVMVLVHVYWLGCCQRSWGSDDYSDKNWVKYGSVWQFQKP